MISMMDEWLVVELGKYLQKYSKISYDITVEMHPTRFCQKRENRNLQNLPN